MTRSSLDRAVGLVTSSFLLAVLSAAPVPAGGADLPACTRVLPGPQYPRPVVALDEGTASPADVAATGTPSGSDLDSFAFEVIAVHLMNLTGTGEKVPVVVEGLIFGFFSTYYFPRVLHRVDDLSTMNVLWSQELPGGLFGRGVVEDVDLDGRDDLRFSSFLREFFFFAPAGFQFFWGNGDVPLTVGQRGRTPPVILGFDDVTGDGLRDALVAGARVFPSDPDLRAVYPGISPREFDEGIIVTPIVEGVIVDEPGRQLSVGDLDEDGLDDVLAITQYEFTHTLGFSRGDGTFDLRELPLPDGQSVTGRLHDLDADGHLDLVLSPFAFTATGIHVGWGRGDGTFEPYVFFSFGEDHGRFELGDVDGDGQDDIVVAFDESPDPLNLTRLATFPMRGREIGAPVPFEIPSWDVRSIRLADVNGDGLADAVFARARYGELPRLGWRPALGGGAFGERLDLLDGPFPERVDDIVPTDFDLDGVVDLFVRLVVFGGDDVNHSLRGDGRGGFEVMFRGPEIDDLRPDRFVDVDADGRPDLVSRLEREEYEGDLNYAVVVRRGDGLGGFLPPMQEAWLGFAGEPGRFRTTGQRDLARIGDFGDIAWEYIIGKGVFQLEVNPSTGYVLDEDHAPPVVELRVLPVPGEADGAVRRLATLPVDECSSQPRVTGRLVDLLDPGTGFPITFRRSESREVLVYEVPATARRGVVLLGPHRRAANEAFAAAREDGGFAFRHMEPIRLVVSDEYGDPLPGFPGGRLVQRTVLEDGFVAEVNATMPGADITFTLTAHDGVRSGVTRASFRELTGP